MEIHGNKLYITPEEVIAGSVVSPSGEPRWMRACTFKHMESAPGSGTTSFVISSKYILEFRSEMKQAAMMPRRPEDKWREIGQTAAREFMSQYRSFHDDEGPGCGHTQDQNSSSHLDRLDQDHVAIQQELELESRL